MASSYRSKESERPHSCTPFPYVHDKVCAKLCPKRRLHVQNRPAGCVLSRTYSSQRQKVPQVRLRKQGVPVSSATVRSEHSPSGFYLIGAHGDRISAPSGDLGDTISRRLVDSPPRPPSFTPTSSSANKYARPCRLYSEQKEIRAGPDSGSPVSRNPFTSGLRGSFPSRVQSLGDSCRRTPSILPPSAQVSQLMGSLNWASGLIPLGRLYLRPLQRHFHSLGLTDQFTPPRRSDPLVLANLLRQWQDLHFLTSGITICTFQGEPHDFYGRLHTGVGRSHGGFQDFGYLDPYRPQAPYQLSGAQSGHLCPTALGSRATRL